MSWSRRHVLRGLFAGTAVAVGLPVFDCMLNTNGTAFANGGALPVRFGVFFWGNGVVPEFWRPIGTGANWQAPEALVPLEHLRDVITVVTGMSVRLPNVHPHKSGAAGLLSGAPVLDDNPASFSWPSVDQLIANAIGDNTLFRSLQTAGTPNAGLSFNGPNSQNPPEADPYALYQRLFGPTFVEPGDEVVIDPRLGLRRSVLDGVMGEISTLEGRLPARDRARLDQHLTGVRELETRLALLEQDPPDLESCARPEEPALEFPDVDGRPQLQERNRATAKLLAMAMACDQTRVFQHTFTAPLNDLLFDGISAGHHDLTHNEPGDQPEVREITIQCMEALAAFIDELAAIPEAGGTLLDNCAVLAASEHSLGRTHSIDDLPIIIAGSACGQITNGIHYQGVGQENVSKVILTLARSCGLLMPSFGVDEAYETDSLTAIEV